MTHTVVILADHKGVARPKVSGDEYVVDVCVDSTNMPSGGVTITAAECGLATIHCVTVTGSFDIILKVAARLRTQPVTIKARKHFASVRPSCLQLALRGRS